MVRATEISANMLVKREIRDVVLLEDNPVDRHVIKAVFNLHFISLRWREFDRGRPALDSCLIEPPDLMLADLHLNDTSGIDVLKILRSAGHSFPAVILTALPAAALPRSLLEIDVQGYIDKVSLATTLAPAINSVLDGGLYFSACRPQVPSAASACRSLKKTLSIDVLSTREQEIARLVTHGFSSKQIASRTNLSNRTVENHRARILARLSLVNAADLVRWYIQNGQS